MFSCSSGTCTLWNLGFGLGTTLALQLGSGLVLACRYDNSNPYDSLDVCDRDVASFWLASLVHSIGTTTYFLLMYLHIVRSLISSGPNRTLILGLVLFLVSILVALMGYTLRYGNMALWALTVVTSLLQLIPSGDSIVTIILGDYAVSLVIIPRALTIHFLGGLALWIITLAHVIDVHDTESTTDMTVRVAGSAHPFISSAALKDLLVLVVIIAIVTTSLEQTPLRDLMNDPHAADLPQPLRTPDPIGPEWYVLTAYCGLKLVPIKWLVPIIAIWFWFMSLSRGKSLINCVAYIAVGTIALKAHVVMSTSLAIGTFLLFVACTNLVSNNLKN